MDKYGKYIVAALFAIGGFTLVAGASPLAITSMAASELLFPGVVAAVAGWLGFGPVSNWLNKTFFNKAPAPTPNSTPENSEASSDEDDDNELESENELRSEHEQELDSQKQPELSSEEELDLAEDHRQELGDLLDAQYNEESPELGDAPRRSAKPVLHKRTEELRRDEEGAQRRTSPRLAELARKREEEVNNSDDEVLRSAKGRKHRHH